MSCPGCPVLAIYRCMGTKLRVQKSRIADVSAQKIEECEMETNNVGLKIDHMPKKGTRVYWNTSVPVASLTNVKFGIWKT
jgi:hypothetical protein